MAKYVSVDLDEITKVQDKFGKRVRIPKIRLGPDEEKLLRIIKAPTDTRFFQVRVNHWGIPIGQGKTPPQACHYKHFDEPCYFCEVVNEYYNSGDPRKADLARRMKASISYTSNVIDLNDPTNEDGTPKVQMWTYSESVFKEICYYVKNKEDWGDIFHPKKGRDIRLQSETVGTTGGNTYTKHKIKVRGSESAVPDMSVYDYLIDLETEMPVKRYTYDQQKGIFDGTLDFRTGEPKGLPGNSFGIPKLVAETPSPVVEESADDDDGFEDSFSSAPVVEESKPVAAEAPVVEEEDDDWDSVLSDDDADDEDEKVADIKAKLKAALNKKNK